MLYRIETQGHGIQDDDIARARDAIDAALGRDGIDESGFAAAYAAFLSRSAGDGHDAGKADAFERIQSAGNIALTEGWHDSNGAHLMLSPA